jgi:hypothetical protein
MFSWVLIAAVRELKKRTRVRENTGIRRSCKQQFPPAAEGSSDGKGTAEKEKNCGAAGSVPPPTLLAIVQARQISPFGAKQPHFPNFPPLEPPKRRHRQPRP